MLDPEFKTHLSRRYGLRGNHLEILDFLSEKPDEFVSAEEVWGNTKVPKGRTYEFLNGLTDWGFVEVAHGKPRKYRFRNPREALKTAIEKKSSELSEIEQESAKIVERMKWIGAQSGLDVKLIGDSKRYFQKLREVVATSQHLKAMTRRCILFLPSGRVDVWSRRYYEALTDRIAEGAKVEYLFSLKSFMETLRERESVDEVIGEVEKVVECRNVDARHVRSECDTMLVSGGKVLLGFFDQDETAAGKAVLIDSPEVGRVFHDAFDAVFAQAEKVDRGFVEKLGMM